MLGSKVNEPSKTSMERSNATEESQIKHLMPINIAKR